MSLFWALFMLGVDERRCYLGYPLPTLRSFYPVYCPERSPASSFAIQVDPHGVQYHYSCVLLFRERMEARQGLGPLREMSIALSLSLCHPKCLYSMQSNRGCLFRSEIVVFRSF